MTGRPIPAPLLGGDTWTAVMLRSAYQCSCAGQCGDKHTATRGRCPREHKVSGRRIDTLVAVPADGSVSRDVAMRLPVADLVARCHDCQTGVLALARRAEREQPAADCLFDI